MLFRSDDLIADMRNAGELSVDGEALAFGPGHDFLEIVTPFQQNTSAGRYIERRKGDGGYMVILQVDDAVAERTRITGLGVRAVAQKDLPEYQYTHFHPADTSGVLLSIDQTNAPANVDPKLWWPPAEKGWLKHARSDVTAGLAGVEIQSEDPDATAAQWSKLLNRPMTGDIIQLDDDGEIRFVPIADGRGPGISAFDVKVVDRDHVIAAAKKRHKQHGVGQVEICGCRVNLVEA